MASEKRRLGIFLGAGTSMSVGIPGIEELTSRVENALSDTQKAQFATIRSALAGKPNVEHVLSRVRLCREFLDNDPKRALEGLTAASAQGLDAAICGAIADVVRVEPPRGMHPHVILAQWLHAIHRNRTFPVEVFTTNYDLLLERAMEAVGLPFFDGFVGSVQPFFSPEAVDGDDTRSLDSVCPPRAWTRLWKLHGSIGWHLRQDTPAQRPRITRLTDRELGAGEELMVFPSREKYADSRRLPFLALQDRLRHFIGSGEVLLLVAGYSFSDEHINEILLQGLRSNNRLAIDALVYGEEGPSGPSNRQLPDRTAILGQQYRNLAVLGPDKAVIGGLIGPWSKPSRKPPEGEQWSFWDDASSSFALGDFQSMARFFERFIGFRQPTSGLAVDGLGNQATAGEDRP
ncbi:MAG: SIR2 family protein [Deltaproteobacteria bacterium]|nr:SIR2 family protein [Deltaproteobacteria bacterium]